MLIRKVSVFLHATFHTQVRSMPSSLRSDNIERNWETQVQNQQLHDYRGAHKKIGIQN